MSSRTSRYGLLTRYASWLLILALQVLSLPTVLASESAQGPEVLKVEPPNWWAGHSINPVRVLIRGRNLSNATIAISGGGVRADHLRSNSSGTYLFADILIDSNAKPGARTLRITTGGGSTNAPFEISEPLPRQGRYRGFSTDDLIYLIMPDRFADGDQSNNDPRSSHGLYDRARPRYYHGGDFQGVIDHLPYLKELGVTAIWLTPWYDNVNGLNEREQYPDAPGQKRKPITDYHGYGAVDFYGVEEHFGTMAKLRELVDAAHRIGIKVIQDQVANHTGPYHPWVHDQPTPTWFHGTEEHHLANPFQTWVLHDPHPIAELKRATLDGWFVNILPDLNQEDDELAQYILQNTLWWAGMTGIDAVRQDTWQYVPNRFWRRWIAAIKREYPDLTVVGEVLDGDVAHCAYYQGGRPDLDGVDTRLDTLFDFPLVYPLRRVFAEGKSIREIAWVLSHDWLYPNPNILVTLVGNHDMQRFMSEPKATIAGLNLAHTLIMTMRGTPQLYYGDEVAMAGAGDPDNRRDFPGGFPGDKHNAFARDGRSTEERDAFEHVKRLGRLRSELEPLRRGKLVNLLIAEQQYVFARATATERVIVAFNNAAQPASVDIDVAPIELRDKSALIDRLGVVGETFVESGRVKLSLPAKSAVILAKK